MQSDVQIQYENLRIAQEDFNRARQIEEGQALAREERQSEEIAQLNTDKTDL